MLIDTGHCAQRLLCMGLCGPLYHLNFCMQCIYNIHVQDNRMWTIGQQVWLFPFKARNNCTHRHSIYIYQEHWLLVLWSIIRTHRTRCKCRPYCVTRLPVTPVSQTHVSLGLFFHHSTNTFSSWQFTPAAILCPYCICSFCSFPSALCVRVCVGAYNFG